MSGKRVLVDSSKNPARALALTMLPDIDLHLLHLVRDPRGYAWSRVKTLAWTANGESAPRPTSWAASAAIRWLSTNLVSEYVAKTTQAQKGTNKI